MTAPMVCVPVEWLHDLERDLRRMPPMPTYWFDRIHRTLAAAPSPQPVQGEAAEHRMMMDDLRLYGMVFSKNGKRIPPEDVYITQPPAPAVGDGTIHPDDLAVDLFAAAMKAKLEFARNTRGRGGWQDKAECSQQFLSDLLRGHVDKGDPTDVANFCCFLWNRQEGITPAVQIAAPGDVEREAWTLADRIEFALRDAGFTEADAAKYTAAALRSQLAAAPGDVERLQRAYWLGWRNSAAWADRKDLWADADSPAYMQERDDDLGTLSAALRSQGQADAVVTDAMVERALGAFMSLDLVGRQTPTSRMRAALTAALAQQASKEQP